MLMLSRKTGQSVKIIPTMKLDPGLTLGELFAHGPIKILVSHIQRGQIQLGIEADNRLHIYRNELNAKR